MNYIDRSFILVESNEVIEVIWLKKIIRKFCRFLIRVERLRIECMIHSGFGKF